MAGMTAKRFQPYHFLLLSIPAFAASWMYWRIDREWGSGYCAGIACVTAAGGFCLLLIQWFNAPMEAEPTTSEPPKRKRRWYQFSLRTLLIFTLICAIVSAWMAVRLKRAERQKSAVEAILKDGGVVWYDYEVNAEGNHVAHPEHPGPAWLRELLGDDFFADAVYAEAKSDSSLEHIADLSQVQGLALMNSHVTDAGVKHLEGLTRLKWVNLNITGITDAGLENLSRIRSLRSLMIDRTHVTDEGVTRFQNSAPDCKVWR